MPFVTRMLMLSFVSFAVYIFLRLQSGDDAVYKFVSWNEFVHDMLAKGEVNWQLPFVVVNFERYFIFTTFTLEMLTCTLYVHYMPLFWKVSEVTVRPEVELAFIRLYPGAIIKGRMVISYNSLYLDTIYFNYFINELKFKLDIEKTICETNNTLAQFIKKWATKLDLL